MQLTDILSLVAIIVSTICVVFEIFSSKRINKINIESKYYEKIFDNILLYEIPKGRKYLGYVGGNLEGTKKLQDAVISIRKNSLFFKYKDIDFFVDISDICMNIEDYLVNCEGKMTKDEYDDFESTIDSKLEKLYTLISDRSSA